MSSTLCGIILLSSASTSVSLWSCWFSSHFFVFFTKNLPLLYNRRQFTFTHFPGLCLGSRRPLIKESSPMSWLRADHWVSAVTCTVKVHRLCMHMLGSCSQTVQSRGSVNELKDWKHNLKFHIKFLDSENMFLISRLHRFLDYNSPFYTVLCKSCRAQ